MYEIYYGVLCLLAVATGVVILMITWEVRELPSTLLATLWTLLLRVLETLKASSKLLWNLILNTTKSSWNLISGFISRLRKVLREKNH